jgi:hypothetical protein
MTPDELKSVMAMHIQATDRLGFKLGGLMARIFGSLAAKDEETYWNAVKSTGGEFVDLTAVIGNTNSGTMEITQEADFVATRFLHVAVNPTTGVPITPSYRVKVSDGGSDRQLSPFEVHIDTLAGTAQRSVPFSKNRLFRRNSTVTFNFIQLQAVATRIFIVGQGYKIFDEAALNLVRRR